jgi:hypothetical protein
MEGYIGSKKKLDEPTTETLHPLLLYIYRNKMALMILFYLANSRK